MIYRYGDARFFHGVRADVFVNDVFFPHGYQEHQKTVTEVNVNEIIVRFTVGAHHNGLDAERFVCLISFVFAVHWQQPV